jgi:hypothetical protein
MCQHGLGTCQHHALQFRHLYFQHTHRFVTVTSHANPSTESGTVFDGIITFVCCLRTNIDRGQHWSRAGIATSVAMPYITRQLLEM